jgi:hypothetical protein
LIIIHSDSSMFFDLLVETAKPKEYPNESSLRSLGQKTDLLCSC